MEEKALKKVIEMNGEKMSGTGENLPGADGKMSGTDGKMPGAGENLPGAGGKMPSVGGKMPVVDKKAVSKKERELNMLFAGVSGKQLKQVLNENKQLKLAQTEIKRAAFLTVLLEILEADISKNGYEEEYQNGQNQKGKKKTVSADLYATYMKNLITVMKQLHSVLDNVDDGEDGDAFDNF